MNPRWYWNTLLQLARMGTCLVAQLLGLSWTLMNVLLFLQDFLHGWYSPSWLGSSYWPYGKMALLWVELHQPIFLPFLELVQIFLQLDGIISIVLIDLYSTVCAGPHSAVGNVSGYRCVSDCRSRGREFDPGPAPYFRGDWSWNDFYGHSPPSADSFKKGCCQLQAKVCARITG